MYALWAYFNQVIPWDGFGRDDLPVYVMVNVMSHGPLSQVEVQEKNVLRYVAHRNVIYSVNWQQLTQKAFLMLHEDVSPAEDLRLALSNARWAPSAPQPDMQPLWTTNPWARARWH